MLYQLSHFRSKTMPAVFGAESQDRTGDTAIFSRVLYRLSYLGPIRPTGCPSARGKVTRPTEPLQESLTTPHRPGPPTRRLLSDHCIPESSRASV